MFSRSSLQVCDSTAIWAFEAEELQDLGTAVISCDHMVYQSVDDCNEIYSNYYLTSYIYIYIHITYIHVYIVYI